MVVTMSFQVSQKIMLCDESILVTISFQDFVLKLCLMINQFLVHFLFKPSLEIVLDGKSVLVTISFQESLLKLCSMIS